MKRTLKLKMILYIWGTTVLLLSLILVINFYFNEYQVMTSLKAIGETFAGYQAKKIDEQFSKAAVIPVMNALAVENLLQKKDEKALEIYLKEVLEKNSYILGTCIAFEPYSFYRDKKYFAPYYYFSDPRGNKPAFVVLGNDDYDYFSQDWYRLPVESDTPVWIDPYLDTGVNVLMVTYATKFKINNRVSGVTTSDIALLKLTEEINNITLAKTGYAFIVSNKGLLVAFPEDWFEICDKTVELMKGKITEQKLKTLEGLKKKRFVQSDLAETLKKMSFNDKEIGMIFTGENSATTPAVKILNNISKINNDRFNKNSLASKMFIQMTIAKEKGLAEENSTEEYLWYTINQTAVDKLRFAPDKLSIVKSLINKKFSRKHLTERLTSSGFSRQDIEVVISYSEKKEMPWFLLNDSTLDMLKGTMTSDKIKSIELLIENRRISKKELTGELKKLGLKSQITYILDLFAREGIAQFIMNDTSKSILINKVTDIYTPIKKAIESLEDGKISEEELTEKFTIIDIDREIIQEILGQLKKDKNKEFFINNKSRDILLKKLNDRYEPVIKAIELIGDGKISEEDLKNKLTVLDFNKDWIRGILDNLPQYAINDRARSMLQNILKDKYIADIKLVEEKTRKHDLKEKFNNLTFNDQEITEILDQCQKDEKGYYPVNDITVNIVKDKLKDIYEFNSDYINSLKHRSFSEEDLIKELEKLGIRNRDIDIIIGQERINWMDYVFLRKDSRTGVAEKLYTFVRVNDPYSGEDSWIHLYPIRNGNFCIGFVYPYDEIMEEVTAVRNHKILSGIIGLTLLLIIIILLSNSITRPVAHLAEFVNRVAKGELDQKISVSTSTYEVKTLALSFNKMIDDLKKYIEENEKVTAEKERIANEIKVASRIQMSIIPQTFPAFPERKDIDIFANIIPALEVGGDFYDFAFIDDHRLGFVIGDASGKGVPAALFVAISRSFLKATSTAMKDHEPGECLRHVNELICSEDYMNMFITMFYGVLDTKTGELHYCNAGHNPSYIIKNDGTLKRLETVNGPALGAFSGVDYKTLTLDIGDGIFLYTDGVTEAFNKEGEIFSDKRLEDILTGIKDFAPEKSVKTVIEEVKKFSEGIPQSDDITVMSVKYLGEKHMITSKLVKSE
ncbi:MAG: SpoIIE family protein phosphatase [Candidatus Eremiobacterota bacterium]